MKRKIKLLSVLGLSGGIGACVFLFWMCFKILIDGRVVGVEPNLVVLITELVMLICLIGINIINLILEFLRRD